MNILSLLATDNYIIVNKELIKLIGLEESIAVGDLASMQLYLQKQNNLADDGFFFYTVETMQENTSLSDYQQRKALETLKKLNIITVDLRGLPAKRYIKLNVQELEKLVISSSQKTKELDLKKLKPNNIFISNDINNNKNNNSFSKEKETVSTKTGLLGETKKAKTNKEDKNKVLADRVKSYLYHYSDLDAQEINLLCNWVDELYDKGKGISTAALGIAISNLLEIEKSKRIDAIKKATLNGWRDFSFCAPKEKSDNLHFSNEVITDECKREESLKDIKNKINKGGVKGVDYF